MENKLPAFSFRKKEWKDIESWRKIAKKQVWEKIAIPDVGGVPDVKINKQYAYDELLIEEISWQLPYGRPTAVPFGTETGNPGGLIWNTCFATG